MNLKDALEILEINQQEYSTLNEFNLKKTYHKMALRHHPDKNGNTIPSKEKFQKIQEAYLCLKREIGFLKDDFEEDNEKEENGYNNIVYQFISELLKGKYTELFSEIVRDIIIGCKQITCQLFEKLDKELSLEIYTFLSKYQNTFHISIETLRLVKEIIMEKYKEDQLFILNPSIQDLFENKVYKLFVEEQVYIVPLWHNECYFDGPKGDIIVKCIPNFKENIELDDDNNIIIHIQIPFTFSLLLQNTISINLEENVSLEIPVKDLSLEKFQIYCFQGKGISKIVADIQDISNKADILVYITFVE